MAQIVADSDRYAGIGADALLTEDVRTVIAEHGLGYVATVNSDGTPNLSPKATMVVIDDRTLAFGDLRSPTTVSNLQDRPSLEINFVDVFRRKGFRLKGTATYLPADDEGFARWRAHFSAWGELVDHFRGIVVVSVERCLPLLSPAYDHGASEAELVADWRRKYL
ncbi:MAG: pyridoxamine 5'-phosphate oxidase family protein [Pseudomonadota bacterium]